MTDRYYDYNNGSTGNNGSTVDVPRSTRSEAVSNASISDFVIALDGIHVHESSHFLFNDRRNEKGLNYRGATLRPNAGETTYTARSNSSINATDGTFMIENFVIDANNQTTYGLHLGEQSTNESLETRLTNLEIKDANNYNLLINDRAGRQDILNLKLSGSPSNTGLGGTASLSAKGNQTINVDTLELDITGSSGAAVGVNLQQSNSLANTLDLKFKNVTGTVTATGSAAALGLKLRSVNPSISNSKFTIEAQDTTGTGNYGISILGQSTAVTTSPIIVNNDITFNAKAGYAISLGVANQESYVTGGEVSGNTVTGIYDTVNTPHGYSIGQNVGAATLRGNTAINVYAPYLFSKCNGAIAEGNLAYNCHGMSYYVKGATDVTVQDNIAVVGVDCTASANEGIAVIAINEQTDGTNTQACTVRRNLVITDDITKVKSLACILADQSADFSNNTYIIPDTVDLSTPLFSFGAASVASNDPNYTIDQWNALSSTANGSGTVTVSNDVIVQMPVAEIQAMMASYAPATGGSNGTVTGTGVTEEYLNSTNLPAGRDFGTKRYQDDGEIIGNYIHTDFPNR